MEKGMVLTLKFQVMNTNLTVCLELVYEHARKTYTACVDYSPSNRNYTRAVDR